MLSPYQQTRVYELIHSTFLSYDIVEIEITDEYDEIIVLTVMVSAEEEFTLPPHWKGVMLENNMWICVCELPSNAYR